MIHFPQNWRERFKNKQLQVKKKKSSITVNECTDISSWLHWRWFFLFIKSCFIAKSLIDWAFSFCRVLVVCCGGDTVDQGPTTEDGWISFVLFELHFVHFCASGTLRTCPPLSSWTKTFVCSSVNNMVTETFPIFRRTLLVQFSNKESGGQKCKYYVPVCLKKVLCLFSACM